MLNILCVCGNGMGTSTILKISVKNICEQNHIDASVESCSFGEAMSYPVSYTHLDVYKRQGHCRAGYRDDADGAGRPFLSGVGRPASHSRAGKYDERRQKHAADASLGDPWSGNCHFYCGGDL